MGIGRWSRVDLHLKHGQAVLVATSGLGGRHQSRNHDPAIQFGPSTVSAKLVTRERASRVHLSIEPCITNRIASLKAFGEPTDVFVCGPLAFVGLESGLRILNISDSSDPVVVRQIKSTDPIGGIGLQGSGICCHRFRLGDYRRFQSF